MDDPVNKPAHYNQPNTIECIEYIRQVLGEEGFIAYCRGNCIKYMHRADYKGNRAQDLAKAAWYAAAAAEEDKTELMTGLFNWQAFYDHWITDNETHYGDQGAWGCIHERGPVERPCVTEDGSTCLHDEL